MRIGIMGGTFDPIHLGHLRAAEEIYWAFGLDRIIFVPAARPPHKEEAVVASALHRYEMVSLATVFTPYFTVSPIELQREGKSYSVETVREFQKMAGPDTRLYFVVGVDAFLEMSAWREAEELLTLTRVIVTARPGWRLDEVERLLTPEQGRRLLERSMPSTPRALRDHAMVAMLIGCGLRRAESLALTLESVQQREEHWVIADLVGKGGHVRTVPIPGWVKDAVDAWTHAVDITHGPVFRAINKTGRVWGDGMSPKVLWDVVRAAARRAGIEKLAPHDLRRTCARLCHLAGGELDQIRFLLGHVSIQTTERYLGCKQRLRCAVNDRLGIEPDPA